MIDAKGRHPAMSPLHVSQAVPVPGAHDATHENDEPTGLSISVGAGPTEAVDLDVVFDAAPVVVEVPAVVAEAPARFFTFSPKHQEESARIRARREGASPQEVAAVAREARQKAEDAAAGIVRQPAAAGTAPVVRVPWADLHEVVRTDSDLQAAGAYIGDGQVIVTGHVSLNPTPENSPSKGGSSLDATPVITPMAGEAEPFEPSPVAGAGTPPRPASVDSFFGDDPATPQGQPSPDSMFVGAAANPDATPADTPRIAADESANSTPAHALKAAQQSLSQLLAEGSPSQNDKSPQ